MQIVFPNMNESHTIHHIIKHAEQHTGLAIEGLSAPHLLKHGRCFGKHETIWQLEVFFSLVRLVCAALFHHYRFD